MGFKEIQKRITSITENQLVKESAEIHKDKAVELNKSQLLKGKDSNDIETGQYSDPLYAAHKQTLNPLPPFGVPDLKLTGAFHKAMFAKIQDNKIIVDSNDPKRNKLAWQYSTDIFGLKENDTTQLNKTISKTFAAMWMENAGL